MVGMGFRRSYVPQKFEARWGSPPAVRAGCLRRSMSVFGEVVVKWLAYGARGEENVLPLDGGLNPPKDSDPHGLGERLVFEMARGSFDQAMGAIETTTGASCPSVRRRSGRRR